MIQGPIAVLAGDRWPAITDALIIHSLAEDAPNVKQG
jgi:hypothetical protein